MKHIKTFESINEAKFNFTEAEIKNAAETLAKAMGKSDKVKVEVHDFEYDKGRGAGFELSYDGDKYDGGSYYIKPNGDVINAAIKGGTKYGNVKSSEKDYLKYFKANESVNEAKFVNAFDKKVLDAETKKDILKIYPNAETFVGKHSHFFGELEPNLFYKAYYAKYYKQDTGESIKGDFKITSVYSKKGSKYVELMESKVNEAEDYKYKKYVTKAFDKISDAMFEFRNAMGVKQLGQSDPKLKKRLELMQAEIFALRRDMKSEGLSEGTVIDLRIVNENVEDDIELALTNWLNTLADGNAVAMADLYLENGVLLGTVAKDIKQGREQIQQYFEMFLSKSPIGSVDSFILQNFGDVCISDGTYTFEIDGEGGNRESVSARYTYVWKKENKKWMIATHHSSVNPK
jgi:uncharacterized protein (TIGR02246 family)